MHVQNESWVTTNTFRKGDQKKKVMVSNYDPHSEPEKALLPASSIKLVEWERKSPAEW